MEKENRDIVAGREAVAEAIKSGRANRVLLAAGEGGSLKKLSALAREHGVIYQETPRDKIAAIAEGLVHQGAVAYVAPVPYVELEDILAKAADRDEAPFVILLDGICDPQNLGAILRSADAAGVHGVLIPKRHNVPLTATVAKTSAGAVEYVPVARVGNVAQTIGRLKKAGLWVVGADAAGETVYTEADLTGALALVIGSEGQGLSRLTRESCDFLVRLPMMGKINSLNASVAAGILMYEALRQRLGS